MSLISITLNGFKSFAKRTTIELIKGINVIIGPNGQGKSNIIDAIRWVLGEHSSSRLRIKNMEEVIFYGGKGSYPMGFADVKLNVQIGDNEVVEIRRKLYRSGENSLWINNNSARIKDVSELLYGIGMRKNSYIVFDRYTLEDVITGRIKQYIEYASGIYVFKERKQEAERNLSNATLKLEEARLLFKEKEKTYKQLKRQFEKVRRFKEISFRIKVLDYVVYLKNLKQYEDAYTDVSRELDKYTREERDLLSKKSKYEQEVNILKQNIRKKQREKKQIEEQLEKNYIKRDKSKEEIIRIEEKIKHYEDEIAYLKKSEEQEQEYFLKRKERKKAVEDEFLSLKTEYSQLNKELLKEREELILHKNKMSSLEKELSFFKSERAKKDSEYIKLKNEIVSKKIILSELEKRKEVLDDDIKVLDKRLSSIEESNKKNLDNLIKLEKEEKSLIPRHSQIKEELEETKNKRLNLIKHIENMESELLTINHRLNILKKELLNFTKTSDALYIHNYVSFPAELIPYVETLFYLLEPLPFKRFNINELSENRDEFLPIGMNPVYNRMEKSLMDLVEVRKGPIPPVLRYILERTRVVSSLNEAIEKFEKEQGIYISREGGIYFDGRIIKGELNMKGTFALSREMDKLLVESKALNKELDLSKKEKKRLDAIWKDFLSKEKELSTRLLEIKNVISHIRREITYRKKEMLDLNNRKKKFIKENSFVMEEIEKVKTQYNGYLKEHNEIEATLSNLTNKIERLIKNLEEEKVYISGFLKAQENKQLKIKSVEERIEIKQEELKNINEDEKHFNDRIRTIKENMERAKENKLRLAKIFDEKKAYLSSLINRIDILKKEIFDLGLDKLYNESKRIMSEIEVLKENIKEIQLRITGITKDKDSLKDKIEELRLKAPESIDFNEELLNNSIEELISEKVLLTEKKEKLGKLNFEAEDFFQVAEASYLSFKKEYDDITEAVKRLKQMLKGIEAEVRRLFNKTFPKIQKAFEKIFEYFFPGGKGEIVFEGSDIFSSRIYLRAVPSGKKTKRLIQLSDGEKAMLGISFLFSLFEISPAPFLLLDELDAPLDDKNIIKFSEYLKHIKKITQIIVVTHNKKTMEIADRLLGVTEDRPGISKVVSVNLKEVV